VNVAAMAKSGIHPKYNTLSNKRFLTYGADVARVWPSFVASQRSRHPSPPPGIPGEGEAQFRFAGIAHFHPEACNG
jgi:hypothetical protein